MKKIIILTLLLSFSGPAFAQSQTKIAAVVNNDIITSRDVDARLALALHGANMVPNEQIMTGLRKQALDSLIDEQIRLGEAKRLNMNAAPEEIDQAFEKVALQNKQNPEAFKATLQHQPGLYETLRHQIEAQIAWGNVVKRKIRSQVNVSEDDISAYIKDKEKSSAKSDYMIAEIFLQNSEENRQLAQTILAQLQKGQRFSVLAKQFSQGIEASKGGMLGWVTEGTLEPELNDAIGDMPAGTVSKPIVTTRGIHIIMVREKRDALPLDVASQRLTIEQIALSLPPQMSPEHIKQAEAYMGMIKTKAKDCAAMAKLIKDINQPSARELKDVRLGDLPSPIIAAVKDLPENKVSATVPAGDGFAFFMVCSHTDASSSIRDDAANAIGNERLNRLQLRYYRDLRAAAYVDIK